MKCFFLFHDKECYLSSKEKEKKHKRNMLACDTTLFNIVLCTQRASEQASGRKISIIINGSFYLHYVSMSAAAAPALCHLTHF